MIFFTFCTRSVHSRNGTISRRVLYVTYTQSQPAKTKTTQKRMFALSALIQVCSLFSCGRTCIITHLMIMNPPIRPGRLFNFQVSAAQSVIICSQVCCCLEGPQSRLLAFCCSLFIYLSVLYTSHSTASAIRSLK